MWNSALLFSSAALAVAVVPLFPPLCYHPDGKSATRVCSFPQLRQALTRSSSATVQHQIDLLARHCGSGALVTLLVQASAVRS